MFLGDFYVKCAVNLGDGSSSVNGFRPQKNTKALFLSTRLISWLSEALISRAHAPPNQPNAPGQKSPAGVIFQEEGKPGPMFFRHPTLQPPQGPV
jgi:hypothetical protein